LKIVLAYIYPNVEQSKYVPLAQRFARSYMENPPGSTDHELYAIVNGLSSPKEHLDKIFAPVPMRYLQHNNWGKDIGAFQMIANSVECDLLVCFGSHIHFHLPGWLDRMAAVYLDAGPSLYGAWAFHQPAHHIRTTAFWLPPHLLTAYPYLIGNGDRYGFEHGPESITLWSRKMGFPPLMVTRTGCFDEAHWHHVEREDCLFLDQHTERIGYG
jgi:hypothetical protein